MTDFVKPLERNHIAVRVLKPGDKRIDDMVRAEVPHQQFREGGGIVDSVELLVTPAVYITSLGRRIFLPRACGVTVWTAWWV